MSHIYANGRRITCATEEGLSVRKAMIGALTLKVEDLRTAERVLIDIKVRCDLDVEAMDAALAVIQPKLRACEGKLAELRWERECIKQHLALEAYA